VKQHRLVLQGGSADRLRLPSGSIQQIAVDGLQRAEPQDDLFAHTPLPTSRQPVFRSLPHDQQTGVASFIGTWPGDESDAELIEALQKIR
jgi:hypothetical protein